MSKLDEYIAQSKSEALRIAVEKFTTSEKSNLSRVITETIEANRSEAVDFARTVKNELQQKP